jgi:hypothetical protein
VKTKAKERTNSKKNLTIEAKAFRSTFTREPATVSLMIQVETITVTQQQMLGQKR